MAQTWTHLFKRLSDGGIKTEASAIIQIYDKGYMDDLSKEIIGKSGLVVRRVTADDFADLENIESPSPADPKRRTRRHVCREFLTFLK